MTGESDSRKAASRRRRLGKVLLTAVLMAAAWPTVRNFVMHNTKTQVHRINK